MTGPATDTISFGPFTLAVRERLLLRQGTTVDLGGRAFDILATLAARSNEVISKRDLLANVWPDVTVEEGSLRFHMANLRKALGDGKDGARYIATLKGRGYCFVAPVSRSGGRNDARSEAAASYPQANLPSQLARMVGRTDDTAALSAELAAARFVTIVGTGGVGKTTVAVAAGHHVVDAFAGAVHFVDLGALNDPNLVAPTVASMLGLSLQSDDATSALITYLADKRILLILDTCEHVIDAAADLAARIFASAPQAHILATSREALQVEGEHVYKLAPLAYPPDDLEPTAAVAQAFPATELFLERAAASGARLDLDDSDAGVVAHICRKLDGVPLAIELAAGRVASYGLQKTAMLLDERLALMWPGQRSAPPRQKTLQATLDWSFGILSEFERLVLRRLAVFVGHFSIDAALTIVTSPTVDDALVFSAIDSLVAKSIVAARPAGARCAIDCSIRRGLMPFSSRSRMRNSRNWPPGTRRTVCDGWRIRGMSGLRCRARRNDHCTSRALPMCVGLWIGVSDPTGMPGSAFVLPPPLLRFSCRCPCSPSAIAGAPGQFSLSTTPCAADARRCTFRRPLEFP